MKLVKTTKHHYIYELSEKEQKSEEVENGYKYLLFLKDNYEDYKPSFKDDIGYEDWEADTLEEAMQFSASYED